MPAKRVQELLYNDPQFLEGRQPLINKDFCSQNIQQSLEASKRDLSCLNFSTDAIIELLNKGGLKTLFPLSFISLLHNPDNKEVEYNDPQFLEGRQPIRRIMMKHRDIHY